MVNNEIPCVIVKVIVDYDYIYNVIDYIASGNCDYDYLRSCNPLQSIEITNYDYPNPVIHRGDVRC